MKITQAVLDTYVERGLLNRKRTGEFTLYCYSKETFFSGDWDEFTKASRGLVFHEGQQVNHPFPKIFNLDEVPEVSTDVVMELINKGTGYCLGHKVNGHLCIVDYIAHLDKFLVHTKGTLDDNEMIDADREMFFTHHSKMITKIRENKTSMTFMFESIHEDDQHTLYDHEVLRYGKNQLVLLGGYHLHSSGIWGALSPVGVSQWGKLSGTPCVSYKSNDDVVITQESIKAMFKEKDTEGYVIWFPSIDLRVKIKTTDYWKMRFRKELNADSIIDRFVSGGGERLYNRYPEEIAGKVVELIEHYYLVFIRKRENELPDDRKYDTKKDVALSSDLTEMEKRMIFLIKDGKQIDTKTLNNKLFRVAFQVFMDYNETYKIDIKDQLIKFIEKREA